MKKLFVSAALTLLTATAFAGTKGNDYVSISTLYSYATGAVSSAHNSSDSMQQIGCGIFVTGTLNAYVSCAAVDVKGNHAWCTSSNPEYVKAGQSIGSDSDIEFFWDTTGNCTGLLVTNNSISPPKNP